MSFGAEQTVPQAPQLFGSVVVSLQEPLHRMSLAGQHLPLRQLFVAHAAPQAPQFALSLLVRLVHVPLQFVGFAGVQQIGGLPPPLTWVDKQQMPPVFCVPVGQHLPSEL